MARNKVWFNRFQTTVDVSIRKHAETMTSRRMLHCVFVDKGGLTNIKKTALDSPIPIKTIEELINVFCDDQEQHSVARDIVQGLIKKAPKPQKPSPMNVDA